MAVNGKRQHTDLPEMKTHPVVGALAQQSVGFEESTHFHVVGTSTVPREVCPNLHAIHTFARTCEA